MQSALSLLVSVAVALRLGAVSTASAEDVRTGHVMATMALRQFPLEITVPDSVAAGSTGPGGTISATLGTVTVTDARPSDPSWSVTVSATDFTTGGGSAAETVTAGEVAYWSGPVTGSSGGGSHTPGQDTAQARVALSVPVTAFSGRKTSLSTQITSWQPTLVITPPLSAVAGTYTGVIVHSVT
ncbi:hypothetical protein EDD27_3128 [Nonomuraea polychroma]|uniref:Uncharacterized protein n=1 Tax=Nonomuraea polychroma TaxID=46176 RepID=A0A438M4C5_9ACTN|nr:hypothetical protein [Nonomuraea polychroma]RVX40710.1 hypothetical protein EDD27_3128 [Nonomuraea polychroma]